MRVIFYFFALVLIFISKPVFSSTNQMFQVSIEELAEKADSFYPSNLDSTAFYALKTLALIEETGTENSIEEEMLDVLGSVFRRKRDFKRAEEYYQQSLTLSIARNNQNLLGGTYNRLGILYRNMGNLENSKEYYTKAIDIRREISDKRGEAGSLNNLGSLYQLMGDTEKAYDYFVKSIKIREGLGDARYLSSAILNLGNWMARSSKYDSAMVYYKRYKIIQEELGDSLALARVIRNIGNTYLERGDYSSALINYLESLDINLKSKASQSSIGSDYTQIGSLYLLQNYPEESIKYLKRALAIYNEFPDAESKGYVFRYLGNAFKLIDEPDSALSYYDKATIEYESIKNKNLLAIVNESIGLVYVNLEEYQKALSYFLVSLELFEENNNPRFISVAHSNIGSTYNNLNDFEKGLSFNLKGLEKAKEVNDLELQERALLGLSQSYSGLKQFEKAYSIQVQHSEIVDSVFDINRSKVVEELITKYETEQKEAEIQVLTAEQAQNEAVIRQRNAENRTQLIAIVSLMVVIAGVISWFLFSARKKKIIAEQKELLFQGEIDSLMEKQQTESIGAMLEGQDKERKRLAAELHDRLGSILSLVKLYFSSMDEDIKKKQPELYDSFQEGNQFLDDAFLEVRAIIKEMTEGKISGKGLEQDLKDLLTKISKIGIEIESKVELNKKLDSIIEMNIYRVVQEALSNSLKYSKADTIQLFISDSEELKLRVKDNGVGFDSEVYKKKKESGLENYGVENMENRVKLLGGFFTLKIAKGEGVEVEVRIPIREDAELWKLSELN